MALGLNIVVGYAGLLDLGYVAFYAIGAYMPPGSPRPSSTQVDVPPRRGRRRPRAPGIHFSIWLVLHRRRHLHRRRRHPDRAADAAPARRLPRDRHARLRRDHAAVVRNADNLGRLQPHAGTRHHADRLAGLRPDASRRDGLPGRRSSSRSPRASSTTGRARPRPRSRSSAAAPARLAPRPRLDRDPRGRDRRRGDGHPAHAHEDLGVRDRRVLRRHRRRVLRELQATPSRRTSSSTSRSSCSAWSSSAAWATISGVDRSARRSSPG